MLSRAGDDLARLACVLVPLLGNDGTAQWSDDGVYLKVCRQDLAACLGIGARRLRQVLAMPPFGATPGAAGGGCWSRTLGGFGSPRPATAGRRERLTESRRDDQGGAGLEDVVPGLVC